jgi:probable F420-dependent oxidoreductase
VLLSSQLPYWLLDPGGHLELGFSTMNTSEDVRPDLLAKTLEERGFDSLFIGEHTNVPTSTNTRYPAAGEPPPYERMMDPFVSLTMAASATTTLKIGTGVCLCLQHDVFDLARRVASLDRLSDGRLQFGVGTGWNVEELANHRPDILWRARYRAVAECIAALKSLWTEEVPEAHGEFFNFVAQTPVPRPAQVPHPPILCGSSGKIGTREAVKWADAWMPMDVGLGDVARKIQMFREAAEEAGRDDLPISIVAYREPTIETLEHYKELGVVRAVLGGGRSGLNDPSTTMPFIDRYTKFVDRLRS